MPKPRPGKGALALRMALIRQLHVYLSVFVAPSLIFFAGSGIFQTFRIPDRPDAPVILQKLARLHRDDVWAVKPKPPPKPAEAKPAAPPKPKPKPRAATTALKWFFSIASAGMIFSTVFGLWLAFAFHKRKAWLWATLAVGTFAPVVLILL